MTKGSLSRWVPIASVQVLVHIVEVGVLQGALRIDPILRLVLQHFLHQLRKITIKLVSHTFSHCYILL
jgi:hypothetical protein